jgi:hypothetical protein
VIFYGVNYRNTAGQFGICIGVCAICLFALGAVQAMLLKQNWLKQGVIMLAVGCAAAAAAYGVGAGLQSVLPAAEAEALQVWHDPNPLAPANFLPQGERPPASCDQRQLEACRHLETGLAPPEPGLAGRLHFPHPVLPPEPAADSAPYPDMAPNAEDPFDDLRAWLLAPQKAWLRDLGMFPGERREECRRHDGRRPHQTPRGRDSPHRQPVDPPAGCAFARGVHASLLHFAFPSDQSGHCDRFPGF